MPKVTVVTNVRNGEKYIGQAVESILTQTFKDFEYLILDDASTDNTLAIVSKYANGDERLKIVANAEHMGLSASRNQGIDLASGEYIALQDADDISVPQRLENQLVFLDSNPEVGLVGGYLHFFGHGRESIRRYALNDDDIRSTVFRYMSVPSPAAMIRKSVFDVVGGYNPSYLVAEDLEMFLRIGTRFKFANLPEVLIHYREHSESMTFQSLRNAERMTLQVRQQFASKGYKMTRFDRIYCLLQYKTIRLLPPTLRMRLFKMFRNGKRSSGST